MQANACNDTLSVVYSDKYIFILTAEAACNKGNCKVIHRKNKLNQE